MYKKRLKNFIFQLLEIIIKVTVIITLTTIVATVIGLLLISIHFVYDTYPTYELDLIEYLNAVVSAEQYLTMHIIEAQEVNKSELNPVTTIIETIYKKIYSIDTNKDRVFVP